MTPETDGDSFEKNTLRWFFITAAGFMVFGSLSMILYLAFMSKILVENKQTEAFETVWYEKPAKGIDKSNAFDQKYEQFKKHFRNDVPGVEYVDFFKFPDGSIYKGQIIRKNGGI